MFPRYNLKGLKRSIVFEKGGNHDCLHIIIHDEGWFLILLVWGAFYYLKKNWLIYTRITCLKIFYTLFFNESVYWWIRNLKYMIRDMTKSTLILVLILGILQRNYVYLKYLKTWLSLIITTVFYLTFCVLLML